MLMVYQFIPGETDDSGPRMVLVDCGGKDMRLVDQIAMFARLHDGEVGWTASPDGKTVTILFGDGTVGIHQ